MQNTNKQWDKMVVANWATGWFPSAVPLQAYNTIHAVQNTINQLKSKHRSYFDSLRSSNTKYLPQMWGHIYSNQLSNLIFLIYICNSDNVGPFENLFTDSDCQMETNNTETYNQAQNNVYLSLNIVWSECSRIGWGNAVGNRAGRSDPTFYYKFLTVRAYSAGGSIVQKEVRWPG